MRLHRLRVVAFGPFAEEVDVDFDALGDAGLFLVHGPTGAGKSSLLDAICFALYAGVPGARGTQPKALVSDHVAPGTQPQVELEFTVSGRRLKVVRSPAFERPKKRGEGFVSVQAKVLLAELRAGQWVDLGSGRADEVGMIIKDTLGLGLEQFATVAMLPQGQFSTFLRAKSEDRRDILERLFRTDRFRDIQEWLEGKRRATAAEHETALRAAQEQVRRVADSATGVALVTDAPTLLRELADRALSDHPRDELAHVIEALSAELADQASAARERVTTATLLADEARTTLTEATRRQAALDRAAQATAELDGLAAQRDVIDGLRAEAARAEAARAVEPLARRLASIDDTLAAQQTTREQAVAQLPNPALRATLEAADADEIASVTAELDGQTQTMTVLAERLRRRDEQDRAAQLAALEQQNAEQALSAATATLDRHEAALVALREQHAAATQAATDAGLARSCVAVLERLHRALADIDQRRTRRDAADERAVAASQRLADTTKALIALSTRRASGLAAELAADLVDGDPCPVCGSEEHPNPADSGDVPVPSAADVATAERERTDAEEARSAAHADLAAAGADLASAVAAFTDLQDDAARAAEESVEEVHSTAEPEGPAAASDSSAVVTPSTLLADLGPRLAVTADETPHDAVDALADALTTQRRRQRDTAAAHAQMLQLTAQLDELDQARAGAATAVAEAQRVVDRAVDTLTARAEALALTADEVAQCVSTHESCPCLGGATQPAALPSNHRRAVAAVAAIRGALEESTRLDRDRADASHALVAAAADNGFADAEVALAAVRSPERLAQIDATVEAHAAALVQWRTVLDGPDIIEALAAGPVDLATAREASAEADTARGRAQSEAAIVEQAVGLAGQRAPVALAAVAEVDELAARAREVKELADLVAGSSPSNELRMSLSSYVLAARLEEVVAHANQRLALMTQGRYELRHTDQRAGGRGRSGLGLAVVDAWTGRERDTATLSGGESFMASLALALGLGDAVRAEAGGLDLQTLFVDEGFGSLDSDGALDHVMDVLDSLRDGGRVVGVVSHVVELRARIPAQLKVIRTPTGSHAEVVTGRLVDA